MKRGERGFTLIELLVTIAIVASIAAAATMSTFQVFNVTRRSNDHVVAVRQVQNAGYWISRDALMAQNIVTDDNTGTPEIEVLTLAWVGWGYESGANTRINTHEVRYTYDADSDKLWRHEKITTAEYDDEGQLVEPQPDPQNSTTFIAGHITSISRTMDGNKLTVTTTASVGEVERERTYEITPRPSS